VFAAAADALGMNLEDLAKEMRSGKTIAQIAQEKNVDVNKVIDALVADANAKIDTAVKDGKLSQDEAKTLKDTLRSAITAFVNNSLPKLPSGIGGGFRFKFGGHHGLEPFGGHGGWGPFGGSGSGPSSSAPNSTTTTVKPATS
jgi:polyhydroxyalkanoate synthesis regulator phasin